MIFSRLKNWANTLKQNTYALYFAARNPRVPLLSKIVIAVVVAYALSPIDLIPDFIPVLGYLDDLILLPLGIWLAIRLIPDEIWHDCQLRATEQLTSLPVNRYAAVIIIIIWLVVFLLILVWLWPELVNIFGKINS